MNKETIKENAIKNRFHVIRDSSDGFSSRKGNIFVIISFAEELDGKKWLHVSLSRKNKYPTYEEIKMVKNIFIGKDKKAIQIFSEESNHVNIHPYCFHLWHCVTGDPLPDFTWGCGSI